MSTFSYFFRASAGIGLLLVAFELIPAVSAAYVVAANGDHDLLSLRDIEAHFADAPSMTVASPPFEKKAIEDGVSRLHLRSLYESWAASGSPILGPDELVKLLEARVGSIWSGRIVADWTQEQVVAHQGNEGARSGTGVAQVRVDWSGDRFRSRVAVPADAPILPASEVVVGTVVSDGRHAIVLEGAQNVAARLYPVTMPLLYRSRFVYLHPLSQAETHSLPSGIPINSPPRVIRDMAESMRLAVERSALFVLPGVVIVDGVESLAVIEMSFGTPKHYFLSLEHGLAPLRIEWVQHRFSADGAYRGRELTAVLTFGTLSDAGDGMYLPSTIQRFSRIDAAARRGVDGVISPVEPVFRVATWHVSLAEINGPVSDRTFNIRLLSQGRVIDDRIRGTRWAFNADGLPDVGEALLIASGVRHPASSHEASGSGTDDDTVVDARIAITLEGTEGVREAMMCTVVAGFVALHQLGFEVSMQEVAAQIGWESGSPRTARDMADAMTALAGVHSDLRRVSREELDGLLAEEGTAVLLLLDLESADVGHVSAIVGAESDGSLVTAEYPQLQRLLTPGELEARWTGEVLVVSLAAAEVTAPVHQAKARVLYLMGAAVALAAGLAFLLVGRKPRREAVPCGC